MRPKLTALAEFDLIEAQNFYASKGDWVLGHFMKSIVKTVLDNRFGPARIAAHFGPIWVTDMPQG